MLDIESRFPDDRMEGGTELERGHLVLKRMYQVFVYLCDRFRIEWWAAGGTALAAVRKQGILPWSGDIDVCMTQDAIREFERSCVSLLPRSIFFQSSKTDRWIEDPLCYRLRDRYSNYYEYERECPDSRHHNGLQVDIFMSHEGWVHSKELGPWTRENTFPLVRTEFLATDCYLEKNWQDALERLYGKNYRTMTRENHSGEWHATRPCDHPASLKWPEGN